MSAELALRVHDLVVRYGETTAVDHLTLDVPTGSLYALLGPNGAGKTSTISCIAGLVAPTQGHITLAGIDVRQEPERARRALGVVPQALALYDMLTVEQNLRFFAGLFGLDRPERKRRIDWGLDLAQLTEQRRQKVRELSGGMKRRLNLACALLHDPQVVLCDEPTTGVDAQSRNHIFDSLRQLRSEGRTIVYTTHYMEEVESLCEHVAIVDRGRVLVAGSLDEVRSRGATGRAFRVTIPNQQDGTAAMAALQALGAHAQVQPIPPRLEDVFLELTGRGLRDD